MAIPKPKDLPTGGVEPKAIVVAAVLVAWTANWGLYKVLGTPWPYCFAQTTLGPLLSEWLDALRAILFVAVLVGLFALKLKWVVGLVGVMVLNLMVPGIVATLFSFGHSCTAPPPPPVAVAEKPAPQAKPKPAPKKPAPNDGFPPLPPGGRDGPAVQYRQFW